VKRNKKIWFLLLGLIVLLISFLVACGKPGYTTYTNDKVGYSISYPLNWQVEVSEDGTKCLITSPTRRGSVMIDVVEGMTAREAAQRWLISIGTAWGEVIKLEDRPMEGFWDWYLSYEYETSYYETFRGEAYFKQTETHVYKLDTAGDKDGYASYPFATMISTFKLR
jgi:hypothetical protein